MTTLQDAYGAGKARRLDWIGPDGDGTLGALSTDFVQQDAQRLACGYLFSDLRDGPTADEQALAGAYMQGFLNQVQA